MIYNNARNLDWMLDLTPDSDHYYNDIQYVAELFFDSLYTLENLGLRRNQINFWRLNTHLVGRDNPFTSNVKAIVDITLANQELNKTMQDLASTLNDPKMIRYVSIRAGKPPVISLIN